VDAKDISFDFPMTGPNVITGSPHVEGEPWGDGISSDDINPNTDNLLIDKGTRRETPYGIDDIGIERGAKRTSPSSTNPDSFRQRQQG
jgi:hypothetical protein